MKVIGYYIGIFTIIMIMFVGSALAQEQNAEPFGFRTPRADRQGEVTVDPYKYRGNPIKFNSFLIWPNLTLEQKYNDNVLALQDNAESDLVSVIKPSLIVKKAINRHEFLLSLSSETQRYWDLKDENITNYNASIESILEVQKGTEVPIKLSYQDSHIPRISQRRVSIDDAPVSPLRVQSYEIETGIHHKPNLLGLSFTGNFKSSNLENSLLKNGSFIVRSTQNLNSLKGIGRISYETPTIWEPYAELTIGRDDFPNENPQSVTRNNKLLRLLFGSFFNYKGLVYGYSALGGETRRYDSDVIESASGLSFDSKISWEPQAKTKLSFDLSRERFEANEIVAGITATQSGIELQHELQRNMFLRLMSSYEFDNFNETNRTDKTFSSGIGLHYIAGPHLQLGADYNYMTRSSSEAGLNLDNNVFMIRAKTTW